ncbi:transthyretin [Amblyraja radiata]|uniref:transthyretin n=1 Tax=Amblyraja radiata TaxID=386614 RepID=UPI0014024F0B|nr:transthyretin [Amblyraja radiata]
MFRALLLVALALSASCTSVPHHHGDHDTRCPILIKVLDALKGTPAANVQVEMLKRNEDKTWQSINTGVTGRNGELHNLTSEEHLAVGLYKLHFETGAYWSNAGQAHFHECANVAFRVASLTSDHYTIAVLLSPYSYSTTGIVMNPHET